jgi:hypothetical protein
MEVMMIKVLMMKVMMVMMMVMTMVVMMMLMMMMMVDDGGVDDDDGDYDDGDYDDGDEVYIQLTSFQKSLSNSSWTTSSRLLTTAISKQFRPFSILTSGSAPLSRRNDTTFLWPFSHAIWRAVLPWVSSELKRSVSSDTRSFTFDIEPASAAM